MQIVFVLLVFEIYFNVQFEYRFLNIYETEGCCQIVELPQFSAAKLTIFNNRHHRQKFKFQRPSTVSKVTECLYVNLHFEHFNSVIHNLDIEQTRRFNFQTLEIL